MPKSKKSRGGKSNGVAGAYQRGERQHIDLKTKTLVLTESGYRCAVPTCREILLLDLHHMWQVSDGGGDEASNLIALCPTCHARYHRGQISPDSIYAWKAMLVAIGRAFDVTAIDRLMFLASLTENFLIVSGDGLLHFDRLIGAGFAEAKIKANNNWQMVSYSVNISEKGRLMVHAWQSGDKKKISKALHGI